MENNDPIELVDIIHQSNMSPAMRQFVADIVTGKLKRNASKKPSTFARDKILHGFVTEQLSKGHKLTSGRELGAIDIVSDEMGIESSTVLKAYQRIKKHNNKTLNELAKKEAAL